MAIFMIGTGKHLAACLALFWIDAIAFGAVYSQTMLRAENTFALLATNIICFVIGGVGVHGRPFTWILAFLMVFVM